MNCAFPLFGLLVRPSLIALMVGAGLLLAGCSKDAGSEGKKVADFVCEAFDRNYAPRCAVPNTLIQELEAGKITTYSQFNARSLELERPIQIADSVAEAEFQSRFTQSKIDFPKEEDRTTLTNAIQARMQQCNQERTAKIKRYEELEEKAQRLKGKLTPN